MAVLCATGESGLVLYDIPDAELAKFALKSRPMDEETRSKLFPGKSQLTRDDAHGVIPVPAAGGDVEGFGANAICYQFIDAAGDYLWWYC